MRGLPAQDLLEVGRRFARPLRAQQRIAEIDPGLQMLRPTLDNLPSFPEIGFAGVLRRIIVSHCKLV